MLERNVLRKLSLVMLLCVVASLMLAVAAQCQDSEPGIVYISHEYVARSDAFGQITVSVRQSWNSDGDLIGYDSYTNPDAGVSVNEHHEETYTNTATNISWTLIWDEPLT